MTDYCTAADVTASLRNVTFSGSTTVTSDTLADLIARQSAVIEQHISQRYTLPITNATALRFLEKVCIDLVIYDISKILQPKTPAPIPENATQEISHVTAYREAMRMLRGINEGSMRLPGETETSRNFFSSTAVNNADPSAFDFSDSDGISNINTKIW